MFRWDGEHEAVTVWEDAKRDLVLLRAGRQLGAKEEPSRQPQWFPAGVGTMQVEHGLRVGYLGHLSREHFLYTTFFSAEVSFLHRHNSPWEGAWGLNRD
jgi:hypothetical protein